MHVDLYLVTATISSSTSAQNVMIMFSAGLAVDGPSICTGITLITLWLLVPRSTLMQMYAIQEKYTSEVQCISMGFLSSLIEY